METSWSPQVLKEKNKKLILAKVCCLKELQNFNHLFISFLKVEVILIA